jgi:putative transposase
MEFFHILNRVVDKRVVFNDPQDYTRFVRNLFILNTNISHPHNEWSLALREQTIPKQKLVDIHAYCLMPNHYHMLISESIENGIPKFMKKINMGYSKYFNERNQRVGALWQGKYKSIHISEDPHFMYIPYYIHLNALDLSIPKWRDGKVTHISKAFLLLENTNGQATTIMRS